MLLPAALASARCYDLYLANGNARKSLTGLGIYVLMLEFGHITNTEGGSVEGIQVKLCLSES